MRTTGKEDNTSVSTGQTSRPLIYPAELASMKPNSGECIVAKNRHGEIKNIKLNYSPSNANIFDMTMEYDDSVITVFEDGRIAAVNSDEITTETSIKLTSKHNNRISDTLRLKIVTPVEQINTIFEYMKNKSTAYFSFNNFSSFFIY